MHEMVRAHPTAAATGADIAFTNVSDTPDVEEEVLGPDGLAAGLRPGAVVVDMSTIAPGAARRIAAALARRDIGFNDAPVYGGQAGAAAGTLAFMCGGEQRHFDAVRPVLEVM